MDSLCNDLHKEYQEDYNKFVNINQEFDDYNQSDIRCNYSSNICNLWLFKSKISSDQNFIITPSLFNSPKILIFNKEQNYIEYMQSFGNVYLLEWRETKDTLKLSDYAQEVAKVLQFTEDTTLKPVNLVGHCIGGNIAIFSMLIYAKVQSLTLLTTTWDYSHFATSCLLSECLEIKKAICGLETVPKIYVQMMFFMLFPNHYQAKVNKYFSLDRIEAREKYLRIEQWLQSGIDIPSSLYNEILDDLIAKNILVNENLYINNQVVSLDKIDVPTCIIAAKEDQIAPMSSIVHLQKEIKKSTLISVEGGHINYLVNNDQKFKQEYTSWVTTKI
ncbi:MAG: hypothetical protein AB8B68_01955 [Rickettsiaceae bacterium]